MALISFANQMWEDNHDTPLSANNLSRIVDVQANSKYINIIDSNDVYTQWADYTLSGNWPDLTTWDSAGAYLNKIAYNTTLMAAQKYTFDAIQNKRVWIALPTPKGKTLQIKAGVKFSLSYTNKLQNTAVINVEFDTDGYCSQSDNLSSSDFEINTSYLVILYLKQSYGQKATVKIIKSSDVNLTYWQSSAINAASPTGYDFITFRIIGGFRTNTNNLQINPASIWDSYTQKTEITAGLFNVLDNGGARRLNSQDLFVVDSANVLNSAGVNLSIEDAVIQTRQLINNISARFYTNRKFGMSLKFTPLKTAVGGYAVASTNAVTLMITAGFLDVAGAQINFPKNVLLSDPTSVRINDGNVTQAAALAAVDNGSNNVLYPGVWRVLIDSFGVIHLHHENYQTGAVSWMSQFFGWYDKLGKRCIGKFRVNSNSGIYIERYSVCDTYETQTSTNDIIVHYGSMVPDGLLPCDGMWHDINGVDTNTYTYQTLLTLKPFNTWGGSWYEETPDYRGMVIKGSAFPVLNVTGGPFNVTTGGGGANDYTNLGGSSEHQHSFEHDHGDGSINIIPSGAHPNHTVTWNGSGAYLEVAAVAAGTGQRVSIWGHEHNISIVGGDHTHQNVNFAGRVEQLAGNNALTALASSWVPYREAIICIKK